MASLDVILKALFEIKEEIGELKGTLRSVEEQTKKTNGRVTNLELGTKQLTETNLNLSKLVSRDNGRLHDIETRLNTMQDRPPLQNMIDEYNKITNNDETVELEKVKTKGQVIMWIVTAFGGLLIAYITKLFL